MVLNRLIVLPIDCVFYLDIFYILLRIAHFSSNLFLKIKHLDYFFVFASVIVFDE